MQAVVITGPGRIELNDVPDPQPGPRDVAIEVAGVGICGTDLHILDGDYAPLPVIPGHEFAGFVAEVGSDVTEFEVGQHVAADPNLFCNQCRFCRMGRANLCERLDAIGVTVAGAAAERVKAPVENCVALPDVKNPADGALIEPLSCVVHAFDVLQSRVADRYLIYGAGTMGLMASAVARQAGAAQVDVVDTNEGRLARAQDVGCDRTATKADAISIGGGWDVVIDCTGVVAAMEDGIRNVAPGGTFLHFGVAKSGDVVTYDPNHVLLNEVSILGSKAVLHSFERAAALFNRGVLDANDFVTHRFPLSRYAEAIETFKGGRGLKVRVEPR
jgi:2-desacetyl-2-hydroxyethyl bacteriochlorophyllide A dehydrogenase